MSWFDILTSSLSLIPTAFTASAALVAATFGFLLQSLTYIASISVIVLRYVISIAALPFTTLYAVLSLLLAPIIYPIVYACAPFFYLVRILPSFEPLYIFLGSAAFVGFVTGTCLLITSRTIEGLFPFSNPPQEEEEDDDDRLTSQGLPPVSAKKLRQGRLTGSSDTGDIGTSGTGEEGGARGRGNKKVTLEKRIKDTDDGALSDWDWLEKYKAFKQDMLPMTRRPHTDAAGVISPILEESSAE